MTAKRPPGGGVGRSSAPRARKSPRGGSVPPSPGGAKEPPSLSCVVPGAFGDHVDIECREWLENIDDKKMGDRANVTGLLESGVLLVVGHDAVLESVCLPDGADRFRFVGALRLLAHRIERELFDDD